MRVRDVDPKIKRLFPWSLFLVVAALLLLATCQMARAQDEDPYACYGSGRSQAMNEHKPSCPSCDEVVQAVGMKPLWLAERDARKAHPELTDSQIAWGRKCVTDHRRALLKGAVDKVRGMF